MPPFKDEQVFIISPGSSITQVQLGLPETFTPPRWRFPTRMFPALSEGEFEPFFVRERVKVKAPVKSEGANGSVAGTANAAPPHIKPESGNDAANGASGESKDVEMVDSSVVVAAGDDEAGSRADPPAETSATSAPTITDQANVEMRKEPPTEENPAPPEEEEEDETEFYDDPQTAANAIYPMKNGRIENWPCFFALLSHIHSIISPPFHLPVLLVTQPCWTARDKEIITQYLFESWKIPALCLVDSAVASCWGYGITSGVVVDIGLDKCDVTAVVDYIVNEVGRGVAIEGCGGNAFTARLQQELEKHKEEFKDVEDFHDLAEKLKRSPICEILPPSVPLPGQAVPAARPENPLVAASTGIETTETPSTAPAVQAPTNGVKPEDRPEDEEDEGVLDVAAIVAQNNAAELLAKRERERAERDAKKKGGAEPPKATRLRNAERFTATFSYEDHPSDGETVGRKRKRELEVGPARFMAANPPADHADGVLDIIAAAIHSTVMAVPDISSRSALWESIVVLGNGAKIRGLTPALIELLSSRYSLSPSNTSIFTSELPSNFSTPVPTGGTNTPIPGQPSNPQHHTGPAVNPLLVAATKNMMQPGQHLQVPGQQQMQMPQHMPPQFHGGYMGQQGMQEQYHQSFRGVTQSPTSMKTAKAPEYFPEWKDPSVAGMEEASFLGAQVVAKIIFIVDQGISKGFLTRSEYNELGPEGIHGCAM